MNLIAAADENWGIGKDGGLLTHLPADMKYFRETTRGKVVVMGRKTLESFPEGKPLKNRVNIVLTRNKSYAPEGVVVCHDREAVLKQLEPYSGEDIFVIGGGAVYREFLPQCRKAYITHIYHRFEADTDIPNLDASKEWRLASSSEVMEHEGIRFEFRIYERIE